MGKSVSIRVKKSKITYSISLLSRIDENRALLRVICKRSVFLKSVSVKGSLNRSLLVLFAYWVASHFGIELISLRKETMRTITGSIRTS